MNIHEKILIKTEKKMHNNLKEFIPGMQDRFNIQMSIYIIHHTTAEFKREKSM